jgi:hypothetical protein
MRENKGLTDEMRVSLLREYINYDKETGILTWKKRPSDRSPVYAGDSAGGVRGKTWKGFRLGNEVWHYEIAACAIVTGIISKGVNFLNGDGHDTRWCNLSMIEDWL